MARKTRRRRFTLGEILSVTTDKLLCPISNLYQILNYLTGCHLYTHQLPRAAREATPFVFEEHPWLRDVDVSKVTPVNWTMELQRLERRYGRWHMLSPVPSGGYTEQHPMQELLEMMTRRER